MDTEATWRVIAVLEKIAAELHGIRKHLDKYMDKGPFELLPPQSSPLGQVPVVQRPRLIPSTPGEPKPDRDSTSAPVKQWNEVCRKIANTCFDEETDNA